MTSCAAMTIPTARRKSTLSAEALPMSDWAMPFSMIDCVSVRVANPGPPWVRVNGRS